MWTWHEGGTSSVTEVTVHLRNHSIDPQRWKDQPLALVRRDDLQISGFISFTTNTTSGKCAPRPGRGELPHPGSLLTFIDSHRGRGEAR